MALAVTAGVHAELWELGMTNKQPEPSRGSDKDTSNMTMYPIPTEFSDRVSPVSYSDHQVRMLLSFLGGGTREVRILKHNKFGHTAVGVFNDTEALVSEVRDWDGRANIFVTLNPVSDALLARANNRIVAKTDHCAGDQDVPRRRALLIDIDPKRPSGISSSDAELRSAAGVAFDIRAFLTACGWPRPLVALSGNGCYLVYRLDEPNDPATTALVGGVLKSLADRFDTDAVTVDTSVANAARIMALIGTKKVKGDSTEDRPHRYSRILGRTAPSDATVSRAQLQALTQQATKAPVLPSTIGVVRASLQAAGLDFREQPPDAHGVVWFHVKRCPFHEDGRDYECGVGENASSGVLAGHCFHPEGSGKGWREFKQALGLSPGKNSPISHNSHHAPRAWPEGPAPEAFDGLAGDIVSFIEPHTEASRVAMLVNLLVWFGTAVGAGPGFDVGATTHHANQNALIVGDTAKARKGESEAPIRLLFSMVDGVFTKERRQRGLASGEGLIHAVRDEVWEESTNSKTGESTPFLKDPGVADKRLLITEHEFARVTKVASRDGNTLTAVLRDAWDHQDLQIMTRNSPIYATQPHVSVIGHITEDELKRELTASDIANGFANRFPIFVVKRSKMLPSPPPLRPDSLERIADELGSRLSQAQDFVVMQRSSEAEDLWCERYPSISREEKGMVGAILARSEAHVLRFSIIYALLDGSPVIKDRHLRSALALWEYADRSARYLFGSSTGDAVADEIAAALESKPRLSRTDISRLFTGHVNRSKLQAAIDTLTATGDYQEEAEQTNGAPIKWLIRIEDTNGAN